MFGHDDGFKIKRKKKSAAKKTENKEAPLTNLQNDSANPEKADSQFLISGKRSQKSKGKKRRKKNLKKGFQDLELPAYEPDEIVNRILKESIKNVKFYEPIHFILTNAKKQLVRIYFFKIKKFLESF